MNDFELDKQLQALNAPEPKGEYWAEFPGRVTVKIRRQRRILPRPERSPWLPQMACGFGLALGCLVLGYFIGHNGVPAKVSRALQANQHELRMSVSSFAGNFESLMLDETNLQKLAPDQP